LRPLEILVTDFEKALGLWKFLPPVSIFYIAVMGTGPLQLKLSSETPVDTLQFRESERYLTRDSV